MGYRMIYRNRIPMINERSQIFVENDKRDVSNGNDFDQSGGMGAEALLVCHGRVTGQSSR